LARKIQVERYYPLAVGVTSEFQSIAGAENPEFARIHAAFYKWFLNGFVMDFDEDGARRWEEMLKLSPRSTDDLEKRRQRILRKIVSELPYTHRRLEEMLIGVYGENQTSIELDYGEYTLFVEISRALKPYIQAMYIWLRVIVPANLYILLKNTTRGSGEISFGGVVSQVSYSCVKPFDELTLKEASGATYFGGLVKQYKFTKVKAGD